MEDVLLYFALKYDGDFNIYYHDELVSTIETIIRLTVQKSIMIY